MREQRPYWREAPNRIFRGAIGPDARRYENGRAERARQAEYARSTLHDGEHWLPGGTISIEECERREELVFDGKIPGLHKGRFLGVLKLAWQSFWHMGMYSNDPYLARIAMVHTAQEQVGVQRQMHAQERLVDDAQEEERMRRMARIFAEEIAAAAQRQRQ